MCVHGFGIETVYEISGADVCAGDGAARKITSESAKTNSATRFLNIGFGVESSGWYYEPTLSQNFEASRSEARA